MPGLNRDNFIYISDIFLNIKQRNEKNHAINMFREVSISNDIISVKFYRNEAIECACDFLMDKDAQGYTCLLYTSHCFAVGRLYQQYRADQHKQEEQRLITSKQQNKASFLPPLSGYVLFVPEEHCRFFAHCWWQGIS